MSEQERAQELEAEFKRQVGLGLASETVQFSREDTILLLRYSLDFLEAFLLDTSSLFSIPQFHRDNWQLMIEPPKPHIALAWPRGTAKTTLAKLSAIHRWLFSPFRFVAYTSGTHPVAAADCFDIIQMLKSKNFEAVFGAPNFLINRDSLGLWLFDLNVPDPQAPDSFKVKRCILKAFGSGQQMRGTLVDNCRPEYGIADDIETNEVVASDVLHPKFLSWFYGEYIKAFSRGNFQHLVLGNMLSEKSLIYDLTEKSPMWFGRRFGILRADGTSLWPEMMPFEDIRAEFREYLRVGKLSVWYAEMMNTAVSDDSSIVTADAIRYYPRVAPSEMEYGFLTVDPAISKNKNSDERAIAVHVYAHDKWRTVDFMTGKFTPEQLFFNIVQLCAKWRIQIVGIELNGFAALYEDLFRIYMVKYHVSFTILPVNHRNIPKRDRIAAWCSLLRSGVWGLQEDCVGIVTQLVSYDPKKKNNVDDLIDACAMVVTALELHKERIMRPYVDADALSRLQKKDSAYLNSAI